MSRRYAARPAAARSTTTRFIRLGPAPRAPRSPAVPNSSVPAKRSARSSSSAPPSTAAMIASSSARVASSGSSSAQARARESSPSSIRAPYRPVVPLRQDDVVTGLPRPRDLDAPVAELVRELAGHLGREATVAVCVDAAARRRPRATTSTRCATSPGIRSTPDDGHPRPHRLEGLLGAHLGRPRAPPRLGRHRHGRGRRGPRRRGVATRGDVPQGRHPPRGRGRR